jgi:NADPH-dependent curcumin reductase CurA
VTARTGRQVRLASRPVGWPTVDDFEVVEVEEPEPADGQVLVRNLFISVDPYMRGRMNDVRSYVPPYQLHEPMDGAAVGEVVVSRSPDRRVGDVVVHQAGWREYATLDAARTRVVDVDVAPPSAYLGVLGLTGFTAWVGIVEVAGRAAAVRCEGTRTLPARFRRCPRPARCSGHRRPVRRHRVTST